MSTTPLARRLLLPLVFISGMASLAVEFGASRLLAPYFGTSLYVWGVLIGLILIYLSAGYVIGGRLADRYPRDEVLFQITAWAGLWIGLIPLVSYPILLASQQGFKELSVGLVLGTLLAVVLLFAAPVILLGCVSPFAIRLLLRDVESAGNTAGRVYALSTAGSILGTFLPVFWFIPTYGTRPTLEAFGLVLVVVSVAGLWPRPRLRLYASFAVAVILAWIFLPSGIKPPQVGRLVYEKESAYGYIQVVQDGSRTELILNEGEAIHSIYDPGRLLTGGPWDYMLVANSFRPAQAAEPRPQDVAILGLAGGTAARQYVAAYGNTVQITGVEIDPTILDVAHRYFHLDEPNVHPVVADARYWLDTQAARYDVIVMDAYRQPYIPFHLTTREFFTEVRDHLRPGGVAVVNAGRTATDYRLVDALASTMAAVYPTVFLVDVPEFSNTLIYGTTQPVSLIDVEHNLSLVSEPVAQEVAQSVVSEGTLRVSPYHDQVFTDDLAPVERLIDEIIFSYATGR
ncbi:MAG TPA: fused MFS/spermidine synthase [Candidatus Limnocylindrales bacterium]|nr:fused MFS/spermidine synthase [Candidatus Limnocylindrales bacterium]